MISQNGKVLPAFGRRLMQARFAGWHPLYVNLVYGDDWWPAVGEGPFTPTSAWLVLKPKNYYLRGMDFRCLAGAAVTVFDLAGAAGEFETPMGSPHEGLRNPFFDLLYDLAQWCGPLEFQTPAEIYTHMPSERPCRVAAWHYAHECRLSDPGRSWPWWWPESLDKAHGEKIDAWITAARSRGGGSAVRQRAA